MTSQEFDDFLLDTTKYIPEDIHWQVKNNHEQMITFRVDIYSQKFDSCTFLNGNIRPYNNLFTLTYAIIHKTYSERIYALDVRGTPHTDPETNQNLGPNHKHRWHPIYKSSSAYVPNDISFSSDNPVTIWKEFCLEANINHRGRMISPSYQLLSDDIFHDI